jgi:hypothetical protein
MHQHALTFAPASSSAATTSTCPSFTAMCRGVRLSSSRGTSMLAPCPAGATCVDGDGSKHVLCMTMSAGKCTRGPAYVWYCAACCCLVHGYHLCMVQLQLVAGQCWRRALQPQPCNVEQPLKLLSGQVSAYFVLECRQVACGLAKLAILCCMLLLGAWIPHVLEAPAYSASKHQT